MKCMAHLNSIKSLIEQQSLQIYMMKESIILAAALRLVSKDFVGNKCLDK